jgi:hypothetical protein
MTLAISSYTASNATGLGKVAMALALHTGRSGLTPNDLDWGTVALLDRQDP